MCWGGLGGSLLVSSTVSRSWCGSNLEAHGVSGRLTPAQVLSPHPIRSMPPRVSRSLVQSVFWELIRRRDRRSGQSRSIRCTKKLNVPSEHSQTLSMWRVRADTTRCVSFLVDVKSLASEVHPSASASVNTCTWMKCCFSFAPE